MLSPAPPVPPTVVPARESLDPKYTWDLSSIFLDWDAWEAAFAEVHLDWKDHVIQDAQFFRPTEIRQNRGDASKAHQILGWKATLMMHEVARAMVRHELDITLPL